MAECIEQWKPRYIASSAEAITDELFIQNAVFENYDTVFFNSNSSHVEDSEAVCENMIHMSRIGLDLYILNCDGVRRQDELEEAVSRNDLNVDILCPEIIEAEADSPQSMVTGDWTHEMIEFVIKKKRLPKERVLVVGDSILTDITAANHSKVNSLLIPNSERSRGVANRARAVAEAAIRKYFLSPFVPAKFEDFPEGVSAVYPLHRNGHEPKVTSIRRYLNMIQREAG